MIFKAKKTLFESQNQFFKQKIVFVSSGIFVSICSKLQIDQNIELLTVLVTTIRTFNPN